MAGIYIHIPFCKQKCSYCDFHFSTTFEPYRNKMIQSILYEIENRKNYLNNQSINTIYFGGGTPSLLQKEELQLILTTIRNQFTVDPNVEVTLECNPDDCLENNLIDWKNLGVNRLSIGLQSFRDEDLKWMNRAHTAEQSSNSVLRAKELGFENITIDLIYGTPNLDLETWKSQLDQAIQLGVTHISAYCLTVEQKTALSHLVKNGKIHLSDEDQQSDQFSLLIDHLESNDFKQYEVSNFAKPGYESKHNSSYWKGEHYLGVGPSAHSFNGHSRTWNVSNNAKYMNAVLSNKSYSEQELLSASDQFNEYILTGLRTIYGVNLLHLNSIQEIPTEIHDLIKIYQEQNLILEKNGSILLSKEGRLIADSIASSLFILKPE